VLCKNRGKQNTLFSEPEQKSGLSFYPFFNMVQKILFYFINIYLTLTQGIVFIFSPGTVFHSLFSILVIVCIVLYYMCCILCIVLDALNSMHCIL
jgi:hypothetical protein